MMQLYQLNKKQFRELLVNPQRKEISLLEIVEKKVIRTLKEQLETLMEEKLIQML